MAGSSRKEENTMPVEIAIKRELTYRRKVLSASHSQPNTNSSKKILPLQVKSPIQASKPMPMTGPNPRLSACFSGTKRKEPINTSHHTPQKHHQPFHGNIINKAKADTIHCNICHVPCSSPFNLEQHLTGHKHREKLLELEFGEKAGKDHSRSNQRMWCETCKVSCMNEDLLNQHFQGKKHKAQLMKLEFKQQGGEEDPNRRKWCELCKLWCIDESAFKQHLEGRKHVIQLHAMKKEKVTAIKDNSSF